MEQIDNLKKAYEKLYLAARNVLELSEQDSSGDYIMHPDNCDDLFEAYQAVYRAKKESEPTCEHQGNNTAYYDHVKCNDCGAVLTDGGWDIASGKWFKNISEAKFYQEHGRLPK